MPTNWDAHIDAFLPEDGFEGTLVGRVWRPDVGGPSVVSVRESGVVGITNAAPAMNARRGTRPSRKRAVRRCATVSASTSQKSCPARPRPKR